MTFRTSPQLVGDYFRLFVNRRAYTVQSARPHPESGRHYYYRPTDRKTGGGLSLTIRAPRYQGLPAAGLGAIGELLPQEAACYCLVFQDEIGERRFGGAPWRGSAHSPDRSAKSAQVMSSRHREIPLDLGWRNATPDPT